MPFWWRTHPIQAHIELMPIYVGVAVSAAHQVRRPEANSKLPLVMASAAAPAPATSAAGVLDATALHQSIRLLERMFDPKHEDRRYIFRAAHRSRSEAARHRVIARPPRIMRHVQSQIMRGRLVRVSYQLIIISNAVSALKVDLQACHPAVCVGMAGSAVDIHLLTRGRCCEQDSQPTIHGCSPSSSRFAGLPCAGIRATPPSCTHACTQQPQQQHTSSSHGSPHQQLRRHQPPAEGQQVRGSPNQATRAVCRWQHVQIGHARAQSMSVRECSMTWGVRQASYRPPATGLACEGLLACNAACAACTMLLRCDFGPCGGISIRRDAWHGPQPALCQEQRNSFADSPFLCCLCSRRQTVDRTVCANAKKPVDLEKQGMNSVKNKVVKNNLMGISENMNKKGWKDSQGRSGKVRADKKCYSDVGIREHAGEEEVLSIAACGHPTTATAACIAAAPSS